MKPENMLFQVKWSDDPTWHPICQSHVCSRRSSTLPLFAALLFFFVCCLIPCLVCGVLCVLNLSFKFCCFWCMRDFKTRALDLRGKEQKGREEVHFRASGLHCCPLHLAETWICSSVASVTSAAPGLWAEPVATLPEVRGLGLSWTSTLDNLKQFGPCLLRFRTSFKQRHHI